MKLIEQNIELPLHLTCSDIIVKTEHGKDTVKYTLINLDNKDEIRDVNAEELKRAIKNKQVIVNNLELTAYDTIIHKDNRKDEHEQKQEKRDPNKVIITNHSMNLLKQVLIQYNLLKEATISFKNNQNIGAVKRKAQLLGINVIDIYDIRSLVLIKDNNVEVISAGELYLPQNSSRLFYRFICKSLDLSNIRTDDMGTSVAMFVECKIDELNLEGWKNPRLGNTRNMFLHSKIKRLNLRNFNTDKVICMDSMFQGIHTDCLDLSSFNTSEVRDMEYMFKDSFINKLNIESFDIKSIPNKNKNTLIESMFKNSIIGEIQGKDKLLHNAWCDYYDIKT